MGFDEYLFSIKIFLKPFVLRQNQHDIACALIIRSTLGVCESPWAAGTERQRKSRGQRAQTERSLIKIQQTAALTWYHQSNTVLSREETSNTQTRCQWPSMTSLWTHQPLAPRVRIAAGYSQLQGTADVSCDQALYRSLCVTWTWTDVDELQPHVCTEAQVWGSKSSYLNVLYGSWAGEDADFGTRSFSLCHEAIMCKYI